MASLFSCVLLSCIQLVCKGGYFTQEGGGLFVCLCVYMLMCLCVLSQNTVVNRMRGHFNTDFLHPL